jgi:crotonobetainyl-CoA:carnitine CoA-transferase CaiB-like acyl-CoA transferase
MVAWCAERTRDEVVATLAKADAAVGPVFDMADISTDEHYAARQMIETVGTTPMQGLLASLSHTPGVLRWEGRALDADHEDIAKNGWGATS